jgi:hypothetical protein
MTLPLACPILTSKSCTVAHGRATRREGNEEQLVVMLRAVPSFEAFGRLLEASNPFLVWTRMMETAWSPWARALTTALSPSVRPPSLPGFDPGSHSRADP